MTELAVRDAGAVVQRPRTGVLDHVQLHLVDSVDEASNFMRWLGERREVLGVDTETGGFSFHQKRLRLVQFGDLQHGWAIPWGQWGGVAVEAMRRYTGDLVLHNAPFDARFMDYHGVVESWPWHRTHDTMTMAHIERPGQPKGLKPLTAARVDRKAAAAQVVLKQGMSDNHWDFDTVPINFPPYWTYAAMDPVLTCYLREEMWPIVSTAYRAPYELEIGVLGSLHKMMMRGARVDVEYCYETRRRLDDYAARARDWVLETHGIKNVNSGPQLVEGFRTLGVEPSRHTAGGAPSVDKYQMQLFAYEHAGTAVAALAEVVLQIRKAEKSTGPYFSNFIDMADSDGRLHPTIWSNGTRTSRMSITDPALQTLPKKDGVVRTAFVPSDASGLITCDMDQIEMRLLAHFSQDPGLIAAFQAVDADPSRDFFVDLAVQIYGDASITKKDQRRQLTKNTSYGKAYGAGVQKMAETAGVPFDVMAPVVEAFDSRFPGVRAFQKTVEHKGQERLHREGEPYVVTPYGRRVPADPDKVYTLVNYLLQCHAAEFFKRKILELDAAGLGDYMVLPVHDELVFDVPNDSVDEARIMIETIMTDRTGYAVPITASADVLAQNWGDKYRGDAEAVTVTRLGQETLT